ncbi:spectrin repeat domain-containing protein [Phthorimaea operculella]|nr:spectrin repeat domain-containing protein [Phthorimaea operculella]
MEQIPPPKEVKILETAEDIQERREQVLNRYEDFKQEARAKREKLEDSRRFQYFKRDADELESWIQEKLQAASDESYKDPTNLQAKIQKHQAFEAEVAAHSNAIVVLDNTGTEMISGGHFASDTIRKRLDELHRLWELLLSRLAEKGMKLQQALVLVQFLRHCDEVMFWIHDKALVLVQFLRHCDEVMFWIHDKETFVCADEFGSDLEHVEVLQRKFDEFQKDMAAQEYRVTEVNQLAERLVLEGHPERETIVKRKDELNEAWQRLRQMALMRQERLFGAHEIQRFNRDADETIAWISEKDVVLGSDDYGRDLATVQTLQRKHEGVERDLAALEDKVTTLDGEAARLAAIHADHAPAIHSKRDEITQAWERLVHKAKERRSELESSYALHRFLADYRDLMSWMSDIRALIAADDLAKDVPGAEALLERHQEHKGEMDARSDVIRACAAAGQGLVESGHRASSEVQQALENLERESSALQQLWEQRRVLYLQCMDLQLFYRDTEQADAWMHKQEQLWEQRRVLYLQCMDLQLFYRDTEQADAWMHKQEVTSSLSLSTSAAAAVEQRRVLYLQCMDLQLFYRDTEQADAWMHKQECMDLQLFYRDTEQADAWMHKQEVTSSLSLSLQALQQLWEQRRVLYLQCMDLQLFYRDTEQADAWMHKQECMDLQLFYRDTEQADAWMHKQEVTSSLSLSTSAAAAVGAAPRALPAVHGPAAVLPRHRASGRLYAQAGGNQLSLSTSAAAAVEQRRVLYLQCMDLQLFYRDTEQADAWMHKQEVTSSLSLSLQAQPQLWEQRRVLYLQCMDLQLFYRDTEQADAWMHKQEVTSSLSLSTSAAAAVEQRRVLYLQCLDLQLFYRDTEQADAWMHKQEVTSSLSLSTSAAAAVGAAPRALPAVHGPAAVLPRHRASGRLDAQAGGNQLSLSLQALQQLWSSAACSTCSAWTCSCSTATPSKRTPGCTSRR